MRDSTAYLLAEIIFTLVFIHFIISFLVSLSIHILTLGFVDMNTVAYRVFKLPKPTKQSTLDDYEQN